MMHVYQGFLTITDFIRLEIWFVSYLAIRAREKVPHDKYQICLPLHTAGETKLTLPCSIVRKSSIVMTGLATRAVQELNAAVISPSDKI